MNASVINADAPEENRAARAAPAAIAAAATSDAPQLSSTASSIVKVEANAEADDKDDVKMTLPRCEHPARPSEAAAFLALWRQTAAPAHQENANATPRLGTLTIGSVVFAPCRVQSGPSPPRGPPHSPTAACAPLSSYRLHYALAEVTGIQVMAGTVTVSFLFTDPGVDDEAISLFECIPCPPTCLARWLHDESGSKDEQEAFMMEPSPSACCSLLERVLRVAPEGSPLPVNDIYSALLSSTGRTGSRRASRLSAAQQRCASHLRDLYCVSDEHDEDADEGVLRNQGSGSGEPSTDVKSNADAKTEDSKGERQLSTQGGTSGKSMPPLFAWTSCSAGSCASGQGPSSAGCMTTVLSARYRAPVSLHVFFARVFQLVNAFTEEQHRPARPSADAASAWRRLPPCSRGALVRQPPVVLALFDSYAALRRFHVYMTVRGHIVRLQDGTDSRDIGAEESGGGPSSPARSRLCRGEPPPPPRISSAFGTECKVWLCMLREDTGEDDANADRGSAERAIAQQLRKVLASAPPIDALVTFRECAKNPHNEEIDVSSDKPDMEDESVITAEQVLLRLLPHLCAARLVCYLHDVPTPPLRQAPGSTAATAPATIATNVVRVSGAIFGDRKLLVPCSPEQLTLLASVLASEPPPQPSPPSAAVDGDDNGGTDARQRKTAQKRHRSSEDVLQALTPALLERIALGTFTDTAASALFDAFADARAVLLPSTLSSMSSTTPSSPDLNVVQQISESSLPSRSAPPTLLGTVEDVYEKWCVDPARFGEAFPVFQAVYALVADVFQSPSCFRRKRQLNCGARRATTKGEHAALRPVDISSLPRVALVLPRGNPTQHPSLSTQQFLHTLRLFFSPWTLHEVGASTTASTTTNGINASVLWYQRGGLLLLFCDEPTTQLGALQDDADVVIACGKAAAAWVAANAASDDGTDALPTDPVPSRSSVVHFAVISEVEVVPPLEHATHLWLPVNLRAPTLDAVQEEEEEERRGAAPVDTGRGNASTSTTDYLQWPTSAMEEEVQLSRGQSEVLWERLLSTVGADGNAVCPTSVPASAASPRLPPQPPSTLSVSAASLSGRRLRHVDVLPKTLRQAVVLWRHLGLAGEQRVKQEADGAAVRGSSFSEVPWHRLRTLVKSIALACATVMPVRMSDVVLVRRIDSSSQ